MNHPAIYLLFVVAVVFVGAAVLASFLKTLARSESRTSLPNCRPAQFLSPAELRFFHELRRAVGNTAHICCKVKLIEMLDLAPGSTPAQRNSISQKHVDFVLCDPTMMMPFHAIELDDRSHRSKRTEMSDAIKDAVLQSAGIRLTRVRVGRTYDFGFLGLRP